MLSTCVVKRIIEEDESLTTFQPRDNDYVKSVLEREKEKTRKVSF